MNELSAPVSQINPWSNNPGFRWLGNNRVNISLLLLVFGLAWLLAYWLTGAFDPVFPESTVLSLVFTALFCAANGTWIYQQNGSFEDVKQLLTAGGLQVDQQLLKKLSGSLRQNYAINFVGVLLGIGLHLVGRALGSGSDLLLTINEIFTELLFFDIAFEVIVWDYLALLQFVFIGIALAQGTAGNIRRAVVFRKLAGRVPIDLLQTDRLTQIANPMIRGLAAPIVVLATSGPIFFAFDGQLQDAFYLLSVPLALFLLLLTLSTSSAVLIVRRRIQTHKNQETKIIQHFLDGDDQAMQNSRIGTLQSNISATEVLAYRDRVAAVWEWPLHGHLPRILFYLTIPPMAWAAAALVEQVIDAALT